MTGDNDNKFKYNAKELEDDHNLYWYHYGARFYDPQLGRWHTVDPMDEYHSPYVYVGNNPTNFTDPDGMQTDVGDAWTENMMSQLNLDLIGGLSSDLQDYAYASGGWNYETPGWNDVIVNACINHLEYVNKSQYIFLFDEIQNGFYNGIINTLANESTLFNRAGGVLETALAIAPFGFTKGASILGNLRIPVYRVFGGGARAFGASWSPFMSPRLYGKFYRYFAGLPKINSATFMIKGSVQLKDIVKFRMALPYQGNFGRFVPEVIIPNASSKVLINGMKVLK